MGQLSRISVAVFAAVVAALVEGGVVVTPTARGVGPTETLTVVKAGDGKGLVTSADGIINCGTTCSHSYDEGSTVTLEEWTFIEGSSFEGWSGACGGMDHVCTVSLNAAQFVTAKFVRDCRVPNLRGLTLRKARKALATHDCRTSAIAHARSRAVKPGRVISQNPKPFTSLAHDSGVSLVVSRGKA